MPVNLYDYAKRMADDLKREKVYGIHVLFDEDTDNVVVHNGIKGFCVTRLCYQTWIYPKVLCEVLDALDTMRVGRAASKTGVKFFPLGELFQKGATTSWDEPAKLKLEGSPIPDHIFRF